MGEQQLGSISDNPAKIEINNQKTDTEFQKYITDSSREVKLILYSALSGWRFRYDFETNEILDKDIDSASRLCNEACANYCADAIMGLISHLTSTSNLDKQQVNTLWELRLDSLDSRLLRDTLFGGSKYGITNEYDILDIEAELLTFYPITLKALNGFTLQQITNTIITQFLKHENNDLSAQEIRPNQSGGIANTIKKRLGWG